MPRTKYKRRYGDRKDGRQLRSLAPLYKMMPYIMRKRHDSQNAFDDCIEVTEIDRYLREKRAQGYRGMGLLHLFIATYVRTVAVRPGLNRFIAGQRIYAHHDITVSMAVKRSLSTDSPETTIKIAFDPADTIFDVYHKINAKIDEIKADTGANNTEELAANLYKLPGLVLKAAVGLLTAMDYFGILPKSIVEASPFHGSMIITDMGSLGIPPIYHHLYDFGHLPLFLSFGAKRNVVELDDAGRPIERKYVDYTAVMDERICDGYYYSTAFKYLKYYLKNPMLLEQPPETIEEDIF